MSIPRRTFLLQAGTAVAGLSSLGCDGKSPDSSAGQGTTPAAPSKKPQVLVDALERMRSENKVGIALRIPTNPDRRHDPGHALEAVIEVERPEARDALSEVVVVCLESPVLDSHLASVNPAHDLILFDGDLRAVAGKPFNFRENWNGLSAALLSLAHGPDGSRLEQRANEIRAKADPSILATLDRLGTKDGDPNADTAVLVREAPRIAPLLIHTLTKAPTGARQQALRNVIDTYVASSKPPSPGPKQLFGVEMGPFRGGCGDDPCREHVVRESDKSISVACGMARVTPNTRSFVKYLTQ
jgi:hypothetical protein